MKRLFTKERKFTIDRIFTMRQILEKTREKKIDRHHIGKDLSESFDISLSLSRES